MQKCPSQYSALLFPDLLKRQLFSEFIKHWQITCFGVLPRSHLPSYWCETKFYSKTNNCCRHLTFTFTFPEHPFRVFKKDHPSITIWSRKKPNYCYSRSTSTSTSAKWLTRSMMFMISGLRPTRQPGQPVQDWAPMSCRRSSTNSSNASCIPAITTCKRTQCNDSQTEAILLFFLEINLNQLLPCDGGEAVSLHLGKRRLVHNIFVHPKNNYSGRCV